jgi:hypothetical protein
MEIKKAPFTTANKKDSGQARMTDSKPRIPTEYFLKLSKFPDRQLFDFLYIFYGQGKHHCPNI